MDDIVTASSSPPQALSAEDYQPFPNEGGRNWRQVHLEIPMMVGMLGLPRQARVMELGCGRGIALPAFARHLAPASLIGVDIDGSFLRTAQHDARDLQPSVELVRADARILPFPDASVDIVIDFGTCFHVSRRDLVLREVQRVLVPGGLFVTETKLSQVLSHPWRTRGRFLPWGAAPLLVRHRHAGLWESRRRMPA